ncbi:MAG: hypothetical protein K9J13_02105 [Saprospiraceae bacterium]|nr:hypothetical protein [Saprospiraceae bacterium]
MSENENKILKSPLLISIGILLIGILFKIQHYPYADWIVSIAFTSISVLYIFRFVNKKKKTLLNILKLVLVVSWSINGIFTLLHLPFGYIFGLISSVSFIAWFWLEGFAYFGNRNSKDSNPMLNISNWIYSISAILILVGAFFRISHWPGGILLLISGLILAFIWFVFEIFDIKKPFRKNRKG